MFQVKALVAKWDKLSYGYNGDTALVLPNDALYGIKCPFTNNGTTNVVKMLTSGKKGNSVSSFLLFHKVEAPDSDSLMRTGFAVVRQSSRVQTMGPYTNKIDDPKYNAQGVGADAIRVYGFESFEFLSHYDTHNILKIETTDGVNTKATKITNTSPMDKYSFIR